MRIHKNGLLTAAAVAVLASVAAPAHAWQATRNAEARVTIAIPAQDLGQALRTLSNESPGIEANVNKLLWANWHRSLGELAMRVGGPPSLTVQGELDPLQSLFLFTRSDTIYGGSNEVQRNIIAERHWGLPRDTWVPS